MKALLLSHSDGGGGAARAAYRLHQALVASGVDSTMHVDFKDTDDPRVRRNAGALADVARRLRISIEEIPAVIARHPSPRLFSPGLMSAISARRINATGVDIVNAHWTNFGYLSIGQTARINLPFVWSLHDMWAFTGGLNYAPDGSNARWRTGYLKTNRSIHSREWDVERWVAGRKARLWSRPRDAIASSTWMATLARESALLHEWTTHVIPNAVDVGRYQPGSRTAARARFGVDPRVRLVVVLLPTHLDDPRKGFDLLRAALSRLTTAGTTGVEQIELAVVGHTGPPHDWAQSMPKTHWLGYLDDEGCIDAYNAADVVVVPSRQDNSPQTATEALACGTPVIAFRVSGLPDFVTHQVTGYLADPEDPIDLAHGIIWALADDQRRSALSQAARARAVALWSPSVVARQYIDVYAEVIGRTRR